jgi:hypothetical protein
MPSSVISAYVISAAKRGSTHVVPLPRVITRTVPSATLSSSIDFPVEPVIRSTLLRRFLAGTRRASPVARHVLATVLSLPPRRGEGAASVRFRHPMLPSPYGCELGPRIQDVSAHARRAGCGDAGVAFGSSPNVTVVAPEKGIKTLQQLVAAAKAKPGSITFGKPACEFSPLRWMRCLFDN